MHHLDFWYDFASPYSYPAAMRAPDEAARRGVALTWRPFLLGPVFARKGLDTSPLVADPVKGAYAWRDLARVCAKHGLAFRQPAGYPQNSVLAARVALFLEGEARVAFSRAVYEAQFAHGALISEPEVIERLLAALGHPPTGTIATAQSGEQKPALRRQTEAAEAAGIFGAPSFVTGNGELFWGHDRMEDALDWAAGERALMTSS